MSLPPIGTPTTHRRILYPERSSHIYYADNDSVPPEKRGQEVSEEDYERICNTKLGACNPQTLKSLCPKPKTMQKIWNIIKSWFKSESKNPKSDDIAEAAKKGIDVWDAYIKIKDNQPAVVQPSYVNYG